MQTLHLDSDDYADMLDFIATGGRAGSVPPSHDAALRGCLARSLDARFAIRTIGHRLELAACQGVAGLGTWTGIAQAAALRFLTRGTGLAQACRAVLLLAIARHVLLATLRMRMSLGRRVLGPGEGCTQQGARGDAGEAEGTECGFHGRRS
ncbi:MAG: hypothetical protein EOP73_04175 [Variovorax sp.]|nr:MAG: hypothetical protein EOP73_04175 [Variovorax sp.]